MTAADNRINRPAEEDEDIILLTDVVEEPPSEVVPEITPGESGLDSLFLRESASQDSPPQAPADADEDLQSFLASLKDEDLRAPAVGGLPRRARFPRAAVFPGRT